MNTLPLLALAPLLPLAGLHASPTPLPEAARPLFHGQVTHPLSAAEEAALMQKLRFAPDMPAEARQRILLALKEALRYPAGREQARALIASPQAGYGIALADDLSAFGSCDSEGVALDPRMLSDTQQTASTLLHELCHARQNSACPATCARETMAYMLIHEAESKAVGWEWFLETGTPGDRMLGDFYAACLSRWREVAGGARPLPPGLPPFRPVEGLGAGALSEAGEAWAQQMALFETRARIVLDFITPLPAVDESLASYYVLATQLQYVHRHVGLILQHGRHPQAFREPQRSRYALPETTLRGNPLFLQASALERACKGPCVSRCGEDVSALFEQASERLNAQGLSCFTQAYGQVVAEKTPGSFTTPRDIERLARLCQQASYCLGRGDAAGLDRAVRELRRISGNDKLPGSETLLPATPPTP